VTRVPIRPAAALTATAVVLLAAGCGGGGAPDPEADARAVREVAQRALDGIFAHGDPDDASAALTPGAQAGMARQAPRIVLRGEPPTCVVGMAFLGGFWDGFTRGGARATAGAVAITGDRALVTIDYTGVIRDRLGVATGRVRLVRVDGRWLVTDRAGE
jgi:hypothetical protein